MKKAASRLLAVLIVIGLAGCQNRQNGQIITSDSRSKKEQNDPFIQGNRRLLELENEEIELYLKRYGWETNSTGTGLRIQITSRTNGKNPVEGSRVTLKYNTRLLNGETLYSSEESGEKVFVVDKSEEITGLHEAVKLMRNGEKARLIIPSHLAYGIAGDGNKIKGPSTLVMRIEITDVQ